MSNSNYIQNVLLCDDVRVENNGKEIAIGIYTGAISVPTFPIVFGNLAIRFEVFFDGMPENGFSFKLIDPTGNALIEQRLQADFADWTLPGSVSANIQGCIFPTAGTYKILTRTAKEPWEVQRSFTVMKVDAETARARFEQYASRVRAAMGQMRTGAEAVDA